MSQWRVPMSKLLLFVAMVIVINPQQASGDLHLTPSGTICLGSCKSDGSQYYCDSIDQGETEIKSMSCSPKNQMTVKGQICNDRCAQRGSDYFWCHTGFFAWAWDHCGLVRSNTNYITSYYGALCYDQCTTRGYNYYWCKTRKGWDYCSPRLNVDYQNNTCKADHPCAKQSESYYWCDREKGSWGYCGLQMPKMLLFRSSTYRQICRDNCEYYSFGDYYYCYTSKGWDYCSPLPDITYRGVPCRDDHPCDLHREKYYWCYTDHNNYWDYCGVIEGSECEYSVRSRIKRQIPSNAGHYDLLQCLDLGNGRMVTFDENVGANIARPGRQVQDDIHDIIAMWNNEDLTNQIRTLVQTVTFRIDMQGMVNRNNQRYYNLQIQRNVPRPSGQSTTYSQVLVPENLEGVPTRYVRRAFLMSYEKSSGIMLKVSPLQRRRQD